MDGEAELRATIAELEKQVCTLEERLYRCPLTGLYNEGFFQQYIHGAIDVSRNMESDGTLLFISIDHLNEINLRFGSTTADETLKRFTAYLPNLAPPDCVFFRLKGALFAGFIPGADPGTGVKAAEHIRAGIEQANIFVDHLTVSIGVVPIRGLFAEGESIEPEELQSTLLNSAKQRLVAARRKGFNTVCVDGEGKDDLEGIGIILADTDAFRRHLTAELLGSAAFAVFETASGAHALEAALRQEPALIIADLALQGLDALSLRASLRETSELARIPFILTADRKNPEVIRRAYALGISAFLERPVHQEELLGLVKNLTARGPAHEL